MTPYIQQSQLSCGVGGFEQRMICVDMGLGPFLHPIQEYTMTDHSEMCTHIFSVCKQDKEGKNNVTKEGGGCPPKR
eukprot:NODE_1625_length_430_cov_103.712871_g1615_i0.p2 GENE.NODE_1625_length_430_cov_103.712871_g1615_i0~~NODE_1625_length_430_cov_103.712871_g1615_i0.p2  ORF type:complete len:76 (+),score=5.68 NODE_1625_length_430_cov_103.712871_g1615_i0:134-361(+)